MDADLPERLPIFCRLARRQSDAAPVGKVSDHPNKTPASRGS
jgi:hypothetical protein